MTLSVKTDLVIDPYKTADPPPAKSEEISEVLGYLRSELARLERITNELAESIPQVADAAPTTPRKALQRFAVTPWNPGGGYNHWYYWDGNSWELSDSGGGGGGGGDGSLTLNERTVSTDFTVDDGADPDGIVVFDGVAGGTGTMIDAATNEGRTIIIRHSGGDGVDVLNLDATGIGGFFTIGAVNIFQVFPGDMVVLTASNGAWQVGQIIFGAVGFNGGYIANGDLEIDTSSSRLRVHGGASVQFEDVSFDFSGTGAVASMMVSLYYKRRVVSAAFTVDGDGEGTDYLITYTGPGTETGTMVSAGASGRMLCIKNAGAGDLTLDATGLGQFFTDQLVDTLTLPVGYGIDVQASNGAWQVIADYSPVSPVDETVTLNQRIVSANFTVDDGASPDYLIVYDGAGSETGTMLNATTLAGRVLQFKNAGAGDLTLDATALGQFFDAALVDTLTLAIGAAVGVQASNGAWQVMSSRGTVT